MKTLSVGCGSALPLEALCSLIIQGMDGKDAQQHLVEYYTKKTSSMSDNEKYLFFGEVFNPHQSDIKTHLLRAYPLELVENIAASIKGPIFAIDTNEDATDSAIEVVKDLNLDIEVQNISLGHIKDEFDYVMGSYVLAVMPLELVKRGRSFSNQYLRGHLAFRDILLQDKPIRANFIECTHEIIMISQYYDFLSLPTKNLQDAYRVGFYDMDNNTFLPSRKWKGAHSIMDYANPITDTISRFFNMDVTLIPDATEAKYLISAQALPENDRITH